jgi:hypothetical protein
VLVSADAVEPKGPPRSPDGFVSELSVTVSKVGHHISEVTCVRVTNPDGQSAECEGSITSAEKP